MCRPEHARRHRAPAGAGRRVILAALLLALGANATVIDSRVKVPGDEAALLGLDTAADLGFEYRDMTDAPEFLYNLYLTYDMVETGTKVGLFYTVQGDTLVTGASRLQGNFVPNVYAKQYDTLNLSVAQRLGPFLTLQAQAKNLTNPSIEEVYRSDLIGGDVTRRSYTKGIEYAISLSAEFSF